MNLFTSWSGTVRWLLLLIALLPFHAIAAVWDLSLVGDMYADGRKVAHPTPDKPAYYYPVVLGYVELGPKVAGDQPPPVKDIVHELAKALADQGYLASREITVPVGASGSPTRASAAPPATTKALQPPPSLVLVFNWGSLRANTMGVTGDVMDTTAPLVLNQSQMIGLTAGKNFDDFAGDFGTKSQEIWDGVTDDRYFVMISAYDFNAYTQQHKKVRLWVAKLSVPAAGETPTSVLPALIRNGGAVFGRETTGPTHLDVPAIPPDGHVEVGTPVVVPEKKP